MIPIFVPSRGRAGKVDRGPLRQMSSSARAATRYVVPLDELSRYDPQVAVMGASCVSPPEEITGIDRVRHWIGQQAAAGGHDRFVMVDDDVKWHVRRGRDTWQLRDSVPKETDEMLAWIENSLSEHAHVGVSAREGNNHAGAGDIETLVRRCTRILRVHAFQTDAFLECEHSRVRMMEDFDVTLQLLRKGHMNAVTYWWSQDQRMTAEAGGASSYRTHALHEASAVRLAELHPGYVRLREKSNKTDRGGFGTRKEVTISWQKAWHDSQ